MFVDYLIVAGTAMLPISELRGAIPLGIAVLKLKWELVYAVAVIGNMIPVFVLPFVWDKLSGVFMKRFPVIGGLLDWLFNRTRKRFYSKYKRLGDLALIVFVAIPLPVTGAWSGTLAAWLFGIGYRKSISLIFIGVLISGVIVTLITQGIIFIGT